jgi:hypothetical protein
MDDPHADDRHTDDPQTNDDQPKGPEFWFWVWVIVTVLVVFGYLTEMFPVPWFED